MRNVKTVVPGNVRLRKLVCLSTGNVVEPQAKHIGTIDGLKIAQIPEIFEMLEPDEIERLVKPLKPNEVSL